ncbi:MAG: hypothetical protein IJG38_16145 [Thermoguttaceae bacterium]|nr:hypothetical protein [Thermoguttaceae bacterium]MBQ6616065.1 hypothetical protein [Thermoguttaceae bacterium]
MKHRTLLLLAAAFALVAGLESAAYSQLSPETLKGEDFITSDGVQLVGTYYPSTVGKEAVPVMIIQDLDEDRKTLHPLALALQEQGCAVVTLDVRGQGDSNKYVKKLPGKNDVIEKPIGKLAINKETLRRMVEIDIETFKRFLNRQNNDGKLNVKKLCLVGVGGSGSALATAYANLDCSWASQGQGADVRALALVSPRLKSGLASMPTPLPKNLKDLCVYMWYGEEDRLVSKEGEAIAKMFRLQRPGDDKKEVVERLLYEVKVKTRLQGLKLITAENSIVERHLKKFIEIKLQKKDFPAWSMKE